MLKLLTPIILLLTLLSCRGDDYLLLSEETEIETTVEKSDAAGLYILCQGNMGSNKCQLDYLDFSSKAPAPDDSDGGAIRYLSNIYAERNPDAVKELGDVGNDIKVYGSKLWMTINCSNKVEVCRASDTRKLAQIDIPNCRYLAFHEGFAYVSSYVGPVKVHGDAPIGKVFKVDTLSLKVVDELEVGYQPDEMAVIGNRLYVANSGGYRVPNYDNRLSIIDLTTFKLIENIEVAPNLYRCRADKYGQLWVSTRGDYFGNSPALYCIKNPESRTSGNPKSRTSGLPETRNENPESRISEIKKLNIPCSALQIVGDTLYYIGSSFNFNTMETGQSVGMINVRTQEPIPTDLFNAPEIKRIESLYGIIVNPETKDFYLLDAKNHVSSGELLHFKPDGSFDYSVRTGDIPCAGAFVYKQQ